MSSIDNPTAPDALTKFSISSEDALLRSFIDNSLVGVATGTAEGELLSTNSEWDEMQELTDRMRSRPFLSRELRDVNNMAIFTGTQLRTDLLGHDKPVTAYLKLHVEGLQKSYLFRSYRMSESSGDHGDLYVFQTLDVSQMIQQLNYKKINKALFDSVQDCILLTDSTGAILSANTPLQTMTGMNISTLASNRTNLFRALQIDSAVMEQIQDGLAISDDWKGEISLQKADLKQVPFELHLQKITNSHGRITNYLATLHYTKEYLAAEVLPKAEDDNAFSNREAILHAVEKKIVTGEKFSLLYILIKQHEASVSSDPQGGNTVIRQVIQRVRKVTPAEGFVGLLSPTELIVLLSTNEVETLRIKSKLINDSISSRPYESNRKQIIVDCKIGIIISGNIYKHAIEYLNAGHDAAHDTSINQSQQIKIIDPSEGRKWKKFNEMAVKLRKAINNGEIYPGYEPLVCLLRNKVIGCEALARWESPEDGEITPGQFLPVAMTYNLINKLTEYMFYRSCLDAKQWIQNGHHLEILSLNVAPRQIDLDYLPMLIERTLSATGLDVSLLQVEVTEEILTSKAQATRVLRKVMDMGVKIAIDDFGTGYSSLSYLKDLSVTTLKVDKSFVDGIVENVEDRAIVESIIILGKRLGLNLIAEGIETERQKEVLIELGCTTGQGYFFSRAKKANQFRMLLGRE